MATVSKDFLTKKAGPLPVYGWAGVVLGLAWGYSKYEAHQAAKSSSTSSTSSTTDASAEPDSGAPYYVIENNLPGGGPNTTTTVAMPPGRAPTPPTTNPPTTTGKPPLQGGKPPSSPAGPVRAPSSPVAKTPAVQKYTVQPGDNLWSIAQKFTGNGANNAKIWAYNTPAARKAAGLPPVQGSNPKLIYPGEVFLIPPL